MPENFPGDGSDLSDASPVAPAPSKRRRRMSQWRVPPAIDGMQVNACRNPSCANFGIPAQVDQISRGRQKGHVIVADLPAADEASCRNDSCANHGKTISQNAQGYRLDNQRSKAWVHWWICRACKSVTRVRVVGTTAPEPPPKHRDFYRLGNGQIVCLNCGEAATLRSNQAVAEEVGRFSEYLELRPGASCPNESCANHGRSIDEKHGETLYHRVGTTKGGAKRYQCTSCKRTFSVAKATAQQRRSEVNIMLFKLLHSRVSLSKIASLLEISPPTLYDKIDFLHAQAMKFQGDRERALRGRKFDELLLSTDRQAYLCNWNRAADARNLQITAAATADTASGYVLAMHVAYDPAPDPLAVEAAAIAAGDYDVGPAYREQARLWLEGDYAVAGERAAEMRSKRKNRNPAQSDAGLDEVVLMSEIDDEELSWERKLPDRGMLVHQDYTLHAHYEFLRRLLSGADRLCFYCEKESGIRSAIMAAFREMALVEKVEAFFVRFTKELTVKQRQTRLGQDNAAFRHWIEARKADGIITNQPWEECRLIRLMEAVELAEENWDGKSSRVEAWINHPFSNMAEPDRQVLHITSAKPTMVASADTATAKLRHRSPADPKRIAQLVDRASLHAVDRYFAQIRRELSGLERGIAVASNKGRVWYGYTPYDPSMIPKLLDIHRVYFNWIQVGEDGLTRAQRFVLARGRIRHQDIVYYR
jgi:hypothetical protein